jgi:peptidoglycan hydrolase CwlO-like protein
LAVLITALVLPGMAVSGNTIADLRQQQQDLRNRRTEIERRLGQGAVARDQAREDLEYLDLLVNEAILELNIITEELDETRFRLAMTEYELAHVEIERAQQWELFSARARFMYINGGMGYLDVLFSSQNLSDLLTRMEYVNRIVEFDQGLADELLATEERIRDYRDEIDRQRREIEVLEREQRTSYNNLETRRNDVRQLYNRINADIASWQQQINSLEQSSGEIENLIRQRQQHVLVVTHFPGLTK